MTYEEALAEAEGVGILRCSDAAAMASFCQNVLQMIVGAASPQLVWEGAYKQGLTLEELNGLAMTNPKIVHELMWL